MIRVKCDDECVRAVIACVWLLGCGRIAFDPLADAGSSSTTDGGDATSLACVPFEIDLQTDPFAQSNPGIALTPTRWVVYVRGATSTVLLPVKFDGSLGTPRDIGPTASGGDGLTWNGVDLAALTINNPTVSMHIYNPTTDTVAGPFIINPTNGGLYAHIAWVGDRYAVTWSNGSNVYLREVDAQGGALTAELLVSTTGGAVSSIAANATHYVIGGTVSVNNPFAVSVNRSSFLLQTMPLDLGFGALCEVASRPNGTFAAIVGSANSGKLQQLDATGAPSGAGQALPFHTGASFYQRFAITPAGYRVIAFQTATPFTIQSYVLDDALGIVDGPTPIGGFSGSTVYYPSMLSAADRTLFAVGYNDGSSWLKLVQTCP